MLAVAAFAITCVLIFFTISWLDRGAFTPNLEDARKALADGDHISALLHLKSLVRENSSDAALRHELGRVHVLTGGYKAAIKEFTAAEKLGYSEEAFSQDMVEAMILDRQLDESARRLAQHDHTGNARWHYLQGSLDLAAGRVDESRAGFERALREDAAYYPAHRGIAEIELSEGNVAAAREAIDVFVAANATDYRGMLLKGNIEALSGEFGTAQTVFQRVLDEWPELYDAQLGMLKSLMGAEDWSNADSYARDKMSPRATKDPAVLYLRGLIASAQKQPDKAHNYLNSVLQIAPRHLPTLRLSAKLYFKAGERAKARERVERILEVAPADPATQSLAGALDLASGNVPRGLAKLNLKNPDITTQNDAALLTLMSSAYAKAGDFELSEEALARARELRPGSTALRMQATITKIASGDFATAKSELEAILSEQKDYTIAEVMLVMVSLIEQDPETAAKKAASFVERHPQEPLAHNIQGLVFQALDKYDPAEAAFKRAAKLDESFHPARINLGRLAIKQRDNSAAEAHFRAIIKHNPEQYQALLGLAYLSLVNRDLEEALKFANKAQTQNPDRFEPLVMLYRVYIAKGLGLHALTAANAAYAVAPQSYETQRTLVTAAIYTRRPDLAAKPLASLIKRFPDSVEIKKYELELMGLSGNSPELRERTEQLLALAPKDIGVNHAAARLALEGKNVKRAHEIASDLVDDPVAKAIGYGLRGDAFAQERKWKDAVGAYDAALQADPSVGTLLKVLRIEQELAIEPQPRLVAWLASHPDDIIARRVYAIALQQTGEAPKAIAQYERILSRKPKDALTLNNLAGLYANAGDARAVDTARRAYELTPNQAMVADTYGWLLFESGASEQALRILEKASEQAPENPDIKYHLAAAHGRSGRQAYAEQLLNDLLQSQSEFQSRDAAEKLLVMFKDK